MSADIERLTLSDEEADQQMALEEAVLGYVVSGAPIPAETLRPVARNLTLADHVLHNVNGLIPRPISPDEYPGVKERAERINRFFTRLWEQRDQMTHAQVQALEDSIDNSLPSMDDGRYGFVDPHMRHTVGTILGRRGIYF